MLFAKWRGESKNKVVDLAIGLKSETVAIAMDSNDIATFDLTNILISSQER